MSLLEERVEALQIALSQPFWHTPTGTVAAAVVTSTTTTTTSSNVTSTTTSSTASATIMTAPNQLLTEVVSQLHGLLSLLSTLGSDPFDYFVTNWPLLLEGCNDPLSAALALVGTPTMKRRAGDRIDLLALLLRTVHEITSIPIDDDIPADNDDELAAPRTLLTPEMTARATELCKRYTSIPSLSSHLIIVWSPK
jgi:hypothetical protein